MSPADQVFGRESSTEGTSRQQKTLIGCGGCLGAVVILFVVIGLIGALLGEDDNSATRPDAAEAETVTTAATPTPPVKLTVTETSPDGKVRRSNVRLRGRTEPGAVVTVNGEPTRLGRDGADATWSRRITFRELGSREFTVVATKGGRERSQRIVRLVRTRSQAEARAYRAAQARKAAAARAAARAARERRIATFKASASPIPYNQLEKNPDKYAGERVKYTGQIFQIQESGESGGILLLSVTDDGYGFWSDNIWVNYDRSIRSAEDDIITVYGTVKGSRSYETQIGGETYVPEIDARYIDE